MKPFTHILLLGFALMSGLASIAHAETSKENMVKAAIIYNLARFSEWPNTPAAHDGSGFSICVTSGDVMSDALMSLTGKSVAGRTVNVLTIESPEFDLAQCHILYLSESVEQSFDLDDLADGGVLTIGDQDEFLSDGGGISIARTDNKLGFSINKTAMVRAHVTPSSKILRLAKEIR